MQKWQHHSIISNAPVLARHVRDKNGQLKFTVAWIEEGDTIHIGASICGKNQQFSRAIGKPVAVGRAKLAMALAKGLAEEREESETGEILYLTTTKDLFEKTLETIGIPSFHRPERRDPKPTTQPTNGELRTEASA